MNKLTYYSNYGNEQAHSPIIAITVMNKPTANSMDDNMVQNINKPNCTKKIILAANKNIEAPIVVIAPERTEIPT